MISVGQEFPGRMIDPPVEDVNLTFSHYVDDTLEEMNDRV